MFHFPHSSLSKNTQMQEDGNSKAGLKFLEMCKFVGINFIVIIFVVCSKANLYRLGTGREWIFTKNRGLSTI